MRTKLRPRPVAVAARAVAADLIKAYPVPLAPTSTPDLARGKALFTQHCASCHGATGDAKGPDAADLDPPPIAFIDESRARERSVFALYQVIEQGLDDTSMRSFAELPADDRWALAFYAGSFAYPEDRVAAGEKIWKSDAALRSDMTLEKLVGTTPAVMAASMGEDKAKDVVAYLRHHPEAIAAQKVDGSLTVARARLEESLAAYARQDRKAATDLALSAYLDGFEPVEAGAVGPRSRLDDPHRNRHGESANWYIPRASRSRRFAGRFRRWMIFSPRPKSRWAPVRRRACRASWRPLRFWCAKAWKRS